MDAAHAALQAEPTVKTHVVDIEAMQFSPPVLEVESGDRVTLHCLSGGPDVLPEGDFQRLSRPGVSLGLALFVEISIAVLGTALAACQDGADIGNVPGDDSDTQPFSRIGAEETVHLTGTEPFWGGDIVGSTLTEKDAYALGRSFAADGNWYVGHGLTTDQDILNLAQEKDDD